MFDLDETLTVVMDRVDELRDNQTEPRGAAADPARARELKQQIAESLGEIAANAPTRGLREIARLRREWILTGDEVRQEDLAREVAQVRINNPVDEGYTFDVGYLVNDEGLQGRITRREARRYSAWIRTKHDAGERLVEDMPSVEALNDLLPAVIRPGDGPPSRAAPPRAYHVYNAVRFAGEAARAEHIANFWPEDEGAPPKGQKWTAIYANLYTQRFRMKAMPLMQQYGSLADVARLTGMPDAQLDHQLICIIRGHELGHFAGPVPLRLTGYPGFEGVYPIVEELRADSTWLYASLHSPKLIAGEAAWRDHMRVFWAEALRYISRNVQGRADSASMLVLLNFMRARNAVVTGHDLRMHFEFEVMKRAINELVICSTQLVQIGERSRASQLFTEHGYDLENRRALAPDAFIARVLGRRQIEDHTVNVSG